MTGDRTPEDKFDELRRQAQKLLRDRPDAAPEQPTTALDLINELQIHQVELDIQNEELKGAQGELSALYREYEALYEFAPCGYVTLNEEGIITRANLTAVRLLETDRKRLLGSGFSRRISQEWKDSFLDALNQAGLTGEKQIVEPRLNREDAAAQWVRLDIEADRDETGWTKQWRIAMTDITERKRAEEALKASEKRLRMIVNTSPFPIALVDTADEEVLYWSQSAKDMFGHRPKTVSEWYALAYPDPHYRQDVINRWKPFLERARHSETAVNTGEYRIVCRDGSVNICELYAQFIPGYLVVTIHDITERKRIEEKLKRKTHDLGERVKELNCLYGISRIVETQDLSFDETMQGIAERIPSSWQYPEITCSRIILKDREYKTENFMETRWKQSGDVFVYGKHEGFVEVFYLEERPETDEGPFLKEEKDLINAIGERLGLIIGRKKAEEALQKSLAEKEVLLREIHHRVKNNMQAIVGLLRMHGRRTDDSRLQQIFNDCRDRITAMSLIHETLYQSDDLARIDFGAYLKKLCRNLGQAYDAREKGTSLTTDIGNLSLNMDQGIAVGLVVSELIANAFKHAFPGEEKGSVAVAVSSIDGGEVELTVSDNGAGLPADFDIRKTPSLGLKLVEAAVTRELGGTIDVESGNGARFIIRFKCEKQNEKEDPWTS